MEMAGLGWDGRCAGLLRVVELPDLPTPDLPAMGFTSSSQLIGGERL